jgi:hypothetical protein
MEFFQLYETRLNTIEEKCQMISISDKQNCVE